MGRWREKGCQRTAELDGSSGAIHLDLLLFDEVDDAVPLQRKSPSAIHAVANQGCFEHDRIRGDGHSLGNVFAK